MRNAELPFDIKENVFYAFSSDIFPFKTTDIHYDNFETEAVTQKCSVRKGVLGNFAKFTGKHLRQSLFFNKLAGAASNFIKKETLAHVFSCETYEFSKNIFITEQLQWLLLVERSLTSEPPTTVPIIENVSDVPQYKTSYR